MARQVDLSDTVNIELLGITIFIGVCIMSEVSGLFSAMYSNFILRDFFGKIIPGFIVLFSFFILLYPEKGVYLLISNASLHIQLILIGISWSFGLAIQRLGKILKLIATSKVPANEFVEMMTTFMATAKENEKVQFERFVIVKETSANMALSLAISVLTWMCLPIVKIALVRGYRFDFYAEYTQFIPAAFFVSVFSCLLFVQHKSAVNNQDALIRAVLKRKNT